MCDTVSMEGQLMLKSPGHISGSHPLLLEIFIFLLKLVPPPEFSLLVNSTITTQLHKSETQQTPLSLTFHDHQVMQSLSPK